MRYIIDGIAVVALLYVFYYLYLMIAEHEEKKED